jgi:hypothetical protein
VPATLNLGIVLRSGCRPARKYGLARLLSDDGAGSGIPSMKELFNG